MKFYQILVAILLFGGPAVSQVPDSVEGTWALFDPRAEPLETELIRESVEEGIVLRHVRFVVGTFQDRKTKVAAFYSFPEGAESLPGIVQIHGGGQFARAEIARFYAARGYAAISINWGEKEIGQPEAPNTDWGGIPAGFLDPKHHNEVDPAEGTLHRGIHPWNSSWLLYSAAARRAITFLEEQAECDGDRIGIQGHSMGGRLTVLTAIDPRVKAASPSVGGSGYLYRDIRGIPGSARRMPEGPPRELYLKTIDCREYWPLIQCPVMFLGATNDFNSPMEKVNLGFRSLPDESKSRTSFTPHMNHRFTADNMAARIRWFDTHLQKSFAFPKTPDGGLGTDRGNGIPQFVVKPDTSVPHRVEKVAVFYGYDRDPRARFWRSAEVTRKGEYYLADCPVMDTSEPLFVFANVTYDTGEKIAMPAGYEDTSLLTVTSDYSYIYPPYSGPGEVIPTGERHRLIDDFSHGWRDWSLVSANNPHHWNFETHKVCDPAFFGPKGASLALELETSEPGNTLAVILYTDQWRGYTKRKDRRHVALVELKQSGEHSVSLSMDQFVSEDGTVLDSYDFVTSLILTPGQKERPEKIPSHWKGSVPVFRKVSWEGGEFAPRRKPYLASGAVEIDETEAFRRQFDNGVKESVDREEQDRK
ncbi:MAG: dienelactone hydrolase family protein [Verrucomicrobiales bacterium]|nr:dienelactone hydrolase family protein [Verrucomicrobiales bacterium]